LKNENLSTSSDQGHYQKVLFAGPNSRNTYALTLLDVSMRHSKPQKFYDSELPETSQLLES
jgi:hypothetical protein